VRIKPLTPIQAAKLETRRRKMMSLLGEITDMMRVSINTGERSVDLPRFKSLMHMFEGYRMRVEEIMVNEDKIVTEISADTVKSLPTDVAQRCGDDIKMIVQHALLAAKIL